MIPGMKSFLIEKGAGIATYHYHFLDKEEAPFYKVWQDTDTETIDYIEPGWFGRKERLKHCFGPPYNEIEDIIHKDAIRRGLLSETTSKKDQPEPLEISVQPKDSILHNCRWLLISLLYVAVVFYLTLKTALGHIFLVLFLVTLGFYLFLRHKRGKRFDERKALNENKMTI